MEPLNSAWYCPPDCLKFPGLGRIKPNLDLFVAGPDTILAVNSVRIIHLAYCPLPLWPNLPSCGLLLIVFSALPFWLSSTFYTCPPGSPDACLHRLAPIGQSGATLRIISIFNWIFRCTPFSCTRFNLFIGVFCTGFNSFISLLHLSAFFRYNFRDRP